MGSSKPGIISRILGTLGMGNLQRPSPTPADQLAAQLEHPNATAIWKRALEVFGDEAKMKSWMNTPRDIFDGRTPRDLISTGDVAEQRRVLQILLRIDYGVFS